MIRHQFAKTCLFVTIIGATLFGSPVSAKAGLIPWVYDLVFGTPRSSMSTYYRPAASNYSYYSNYSSNYGPSTDGVVWHAPSPYSNSACIPCIPKCPTSNCSVSATAAKPTPAADKISENKTFADGQTAEAEKSENTGFRAAKKPLDAGQEPTDGDAELDVRLTTLEEQNKAILLQLEQVRLSLEGLNELKTKVAEIEKEQEKRGFKPAKIGTPGANDPKTAVPVTPPAKTP